MNSHTRSLAFSFILLILVSVSCSLRKAPVLINCSGETQGTYYAITYYSDDSINLQPSIDSILIRFDSTASTYKNNSIISRMNNNDRCSR